MSSIVTKLAERGLISPPPFVSGSVQYEVIMGSEAYGVSSDDSDRDIYGFCIPPKSVVFPHLAGEIIGFDPQKKRFEQFDQHHVQDSEARNGRGCEYDFAIYNIVKYARLVMDNNPNMIDSLFVPDRCVVFITEIGQMFRDARRDFLTKRSYHTCKGYAFQQAKKMRNKKPKPGSKRYEDVKKHGYSTKFAYHIVRLLNQAEQILVEHDLELDRNREQLKSIRRGEWSLEQVEFYFNEKERDLERLYAKSTLRHSPDTERIKSLLLRCLEQYYGSLEKAVEMPDQEKRVLRQIDELVQQVRHRL